MKRSRQIIATAAVALAVASPAIASAPNEAAKALPCSAHMDKTHPADNSTVHVIVRTAAHANTRAVAHYKTTSTGHSRRADRHGNTSIPFDIGPATPGFLVKVTVTVTKRDRPAGSCKTSFRLHR